MHYIKTPEGITALQTRDRILSTKQRQLLILIGCNEFEKLSDILKEKLCTSDLIESLLSLGFIKRDSFSNQSATPSQATEVVSKADVAEIINHVTAAEPEATPLVKEAIAPAAPEVKTYDDIEYSLDNMKSMISTALNTYCGLMARAHARNVSNCASVSELKRSHMISITLLQESNIPKSELLDLTKILKIFYENN
ncbi:hypothetical protein GCM10027155_18090 [Acinetobacter apis]|uniref:Uncharacterized protein n=1 Tax=Acinetobacter apis TaxID=1229165 RepID=A0A217EGK7_9GAMM|nr:hypothetical protein [Acinetobacter apis]SNQ29452.1 hypothetical protein SAMN05444584_1406 [Acinetobacter apis]